MKPYVLITGATAGIGKATATLLGKQGFNLILTGRREERLDKITTELEKEFSISATALSFDISSRKECEDIFSQHAELLAKVSVLINNAGLARGVAPMDQADLDHWDQMIDTNIKGLLYVTRLLLPTLKKQDNPHIVNLGSVAGRWTYPGGNIYCATKFAVRAISESLRLDLQGEGVRVSNIAPGIAETEFCTVRYDSEEKSKEFYSNMTPLSPEDIAESIWWCLNRPAHVNIHEMIIYPTDQAGVGHVHRS